MNAETVTLVAALIAAGGSWLNVYLTARTERRKLVWSKEIDRFFELEEPAGRLVEELGSYHSIPEDRRTLVESFQTLGVQAGRFARYPEVRQAVRDLRNVLGRLFAAKRDHEADRDIRGEVESAHRRLLEACDDVLKGRKI